MTKDDIPVSMLKDFDAHLDQLSKREKKCRRRMMVSIFLAVAGCALLIALGLGVLHYVASLLVIGFGSFSGGCFWYATNRDTLIDTGERMTSLRAMRADIMAVKSGGS